MGSPRPNIRERSRSGPEVCREKKTQEKETERMKEGTLRAAPRIFVTPSPCSNAMPMHCAGIRTRMHGYDTDIGPAPAPASSEPRASSNDRARILDPSHDYPQQQYACAHAGKKTEDLELTQIRVQIRLRAGPGRCAGPADADEDVRRTGRCSTVSSTPSWV